MRFAGAHCTVLATALAFAKPIVVSDIGADCLTNVGTPAEAALNDYIDAYSKSDTYRYSHGDNFSYAYSHWNTKLHSAGYSNAQVKPVAKAASNAPSAALACTPRIRVKPPVIRGNRPL